MHPSAGVLAVIRGQVVYLASGYLADLDGSADHIGGALFAFRVSRNLCVPRS